MENKEIYIDGVDVSGCEFYLPYSEKCECIVDDNGNKNIFCWEYRDCYYKRMYHTGQEKDIYKNENKELYKQLQAKEQECEELKEEALHSDYGIMKNNLEGAITYLEKENKDLSKIIDCKNGTVLSLKQQLDQLKAENDQLKRQHQGDKGLITATGKQNYQLLQEYDKLKTALTEIKEIAESEMDSKEFMTVQCMLNGSVDNKNKVLKQVLQKISDLEV